MDVICERCGTEYEFDETLLSARGTSVKCTNCGHVFKVYPRGADQAERASRWRLRRPDGTTDALDSLRELQRRITAGELTPDDEIARGDDDWKKLGSIPELETFFHAAGVRIPSPRTRSPIPPAPPRHQAAGRDSSVPPGRRPRQPTLLGVSPMPAAVPVTAATATARASAPGAEPAAAPGAEPTTGPAAATEAVFESAPESLLEPEWEGLEPWPDSADPDLESLRDSSLPSSESLRDSFGPGLESLRDSSAPESPESSAGSGLEALRDSSAGIEDAEFEEAPRSQARRSTPPPAYFDDDNEIPDLPARARSPLGWLLLIVVVGGLALVASQWERVARLAGIGSDPAVIAAGITEGDASLALGEPSAYEQAIEAYRRAVDAGGDQDPELVAKLSNAYALAAQARMDEGETGGFVESLKATALGHARRASALDPQSIAARLAEADALRLTGDHAAARAVLGEARAMSFSRTAEAFRVDARLSAAEAGGGLEHGLQSARQAVALSRDGVRFLLLLARAEHAAGNDARAEEALEAVLADHPGHSVATKLREQLRASAATAAAAAAGTEPETAAAAGTEPETATATEPETAEPAPATAAPTAAAPEPAPEPAKAPPAAKPPTAAKPAVTGPATAPPTQSPKTAAPKRTAPSRAVREPAPKKPQYDEYDQLSKAAQSDALADGRPQVRDYEWHMSRGWDELAAGSYARAKAFFDSALEVKPGSADAMDGLGQVAMGTEDFASAVRYFRVAAERGHPDGYYKLGRAYERLDRKEEAVSAYYTYVKRNPTGAYAAAARASIKALEPHAKLPEPPPEQSPAPSEPSQKSGPDLP
jgi:predicted Zn finger-like uncharacterized protein